MGLSNLDVEKFLIEFEILKNQLAVILENTKYNNTYLKLDASNDPITGDLQLGIDGNGVDLLAYGATSGRHILWDASANSFFVNGPFDVKVGTSNRIFLQELGGFGGVAIGEGSSAGPLSVCFGAGAGARYGNSTFNLFLGFQSGGIGTSGGIAGGNVGLGAQTMARGTTGQSNTCIGNISGAFITTGQNNVVIGGSSGSALTTGSRNITIGAGVQTTAEDSLEEFALGSSIGGASTILRGKFTNGSEELGIPLDDAPFYLGAASTTDSYLSFDSANLDIFSSGEFDFMTDANEDIIFNFIGTTNSGKLSWMEDEDYFEFADTVKFNQGIIKNIQTKTSDYTLIKSDYVIIADGTSNTVTITLPVSPNTGQLFTIKCKDSTNTVTVDRNGKTIDGDAIDIILIKNEVITAMYDGAEWWLV
jgi:hypothetical protein